MTEEEWLTADDPLTLLNCVKGSARERKLRLFSVACCRRRAYLMLEERYWNPVEFAERFADGLESASDRRATAKALNNWEMEPFGGKSAAGAVVSMPAFHSAESASWYVADFTTDTDGQYRGWREAFDVERAVQAALLRDIFGNPFRPVVFDPAWRSETAVDIAAGIYEDRAFERMPILADALQEAGCEHADILTHCREPGTHVRGCWVIDLVLGKE